MSTIKRNKFVDEKVKPLVRDSYPKLVARIEQLEKTVKSIKRTMSAMKKTSGGKADPKPKAPKKDTKKTKTEPKKKAEANKTQPKKDQGAKKGK